jgi:tRNA(His) 5'-end guanylyltransferase
MKDELGTRMKDFYEDRNRTYLTRRTNTIIRLDGKAFHTFTKGFKRPFDEGLANAMDETTKYLCANIQGAKFGYVQSDEISILITDYDDVKTDAWFDYNVQKMTSVSASMATMAFNEEMAKLGITKRALFDSRVFQVPYEEEVVNYFIWRQQDATRNSISMLAQANFSHKLLHGKKVNEMQDMLMLEKNINWNNETPRFKRGGSCIKVQTVGPNDSVRNKWTMVETPIFTKDRNFIKNIFPTNQ